MAGKIYEDREIGNVTLRRSARSRRVSIRIHPRRGVSVSVPWFMSWRSGLQFFLSKRDWVLKTLARQQARAASDEEAGRAVTGLGDGALVHTLLSEILFVEEPQGSRGGGDSSPRGQRILFVKSPQGARSGSPAPSDRECGIVTVSTTSVEDTRRTGRLYLNLEQPLFRKEVRFSPGVDLQRVLVEILRSEAKDLLPRKLRLLAGRYGFEYGRVTVKHNSSNWGSCSRKGNINLNLNLVRLPEPLCDYVLLHELCHLHHPDHGPLFHQALEKLCTDHLRRLSTLGDPFAASLLADRKTRSCTRATDEYLSRQVARYRLL